LAAAACSSNGAKCWPTKVVAEVYTRPRLSVYVCGIESNVMVKFRFGCVAVFFIIYNFGCFDCWTSGHAGQGVSLLPLLYLQPLRVKDAMNNTIEVVGRGPVQPVQMSKCVF
jgi:hypothetical protein